MGRPAGRRNLDHDSKRAELSLKLRDALIRLGPGASLRELAEASGSSLGNLRHYFGDRDSVFTAVAQVLEESGRPYMEGAMRPSAGPVDRALMFFLDYLVLGWRRFGVGRIHAVTLAEGLGSTTLGPRYVQHVLEPTLRSCEGLLEALVADGRLPPLDSRVAGLGLIGPVVLALLHQDELGGVACRPLDLDAFLEEHLDAWLRSWASPSHSPEMPA